MRNFINYLRKIVAVWALFSSSILFGQILNFSGGQGVGDASSKTLELSYLSGNGGKLFFNGGIGNGSAVRMSEAMALSGVNPNPNYFGGIGNGSAIGVTNSVFLNGNNSDLKFLGSFGKGDKLETSLRISLNGDPGDISFRGGIGGGSSSIVVGSLSLGGANNSVNFLGGSGRGDGNNRTTNLILLSGIVYNMSFAGGVGQGYVNRKSSSLTLNGVVSGGGLRISNRKIVDFEVAADDENIILKWKSSVGNNIKYFEIEKSHSGDLFSQIGIVNSNSYSQDYFFSYFPGKESELYFRLKSVDEDLNLNYSDAIKVDLDRREDLVSIFPNPVKDKLHINCSSPNGVTVSVYSLNGKLHSISRFDDSAKIEISIKDFQDGIYLAQLDFGQKIKRFKFVKN